MRLTILKMCMAGVAASLFYACGDDVSDVDSDSSVAVVDSVEKTSAQLSGIRVHYECECDVKGVCECSQEPKQEFDYMCNGCHSFLPSEEVPEKKWMEKMRSTVFQGKSDEEIYRIVAGKGGAFEKERLESMNVSFFQDERDGKIYRTVKIGEQVWMAQNLDYAVVNDSNEIFEEDRALCDYDCNYLYTLEPSWCFDNDSAMCGEYGRLYTWSAAVGKPDGECSKGTLCNLPSGNVQGVCPDGWHLPSKEEFETLVAAVGGETLAHTRLRSSVGWFDFNDEPVPGGSDDVGFSAFPSGYYFMANVDFYGLGQNAIFWSSTEYDEKEVYELSIAVNDDKAEIPHGERIFAESVRCVKD